MTDGFAVADGAGDKTVVAAAAAWLGLFSDMCLCLDQRSTK